MYSCILLSYYDVDIKYDFEWVFGSNIFVYSVVFTDVLPYALLCSYFLLKILQIVLTVT